MTFPVYLSCIGLGLLCSLVSLSLRKPQREEKRAHEYIFFLIFYVLAFELYAFYLVQNGQKNVLVYNIFFVCGETLLILIYLKSLVDLETVKKRIDQFMMFFTVWAIVNSIFFQKPTDLFQQYTHLLGSFGIVVVSCYLLYRVFLEEGFWDQPLLRVPHFWNVAAILLFYCPNFIYFGAINILWDIDKWYLTVLASMNRVFAALLYLILGLSFYSSYIFSTNRYGR